MNRLKGAFDVRNVATWSVFIVWLAFCVASYLAVAPPTPVPVWQRLGLAVLAAVGAWVPVLVLARFRGSGGPPRGHVFVLIAVVVLVGVIRGLLMAAGSMALGLDDTFRFPYRITAGLTVSFTVLIPMAFVVQGSQVHLRQMRRLRQLALQLEQVRDQAQISVSESSTEVVDGIRQRILTEVERLDPTAPADSLATLKQTASEIVRPLSHDLASQVPRWDPAESSIDESARLDWRAIAAARATPRPLRPLASAGVLALFAINPAINLLSGLARWAFLIVIFLAAFITLWLANQAIARTPARVPRSVVAVAALLGAGLVGTGMLLVVLPPLTGDLGRSAAISCAFFIPAMGGAGGLLTAIRSEQRAAETRLEVLTEDMRWQVARLGQVQWYQQRALSRALHGPVQSAVTAAAIRLEGALRTGGDSATLVEEIQQDLSRVIGLIGAPATGGVEHEGAVLSETLERVEAIWSNLARIDMDVDAGARDALNGDPIAGACVAELISELTSNAVRHGGAGHVVITLSCTEFTVTLEVADDGLVKEATGTGLGTRMLEEMTISTTRSRTDEGLTRVAAVVPVELALS